MVNLNVLQRTGLGRNVGVDIAGAVFGIREVEYGTLFGEMFLGNDVNGVYLQVLEERGAKGPAVLPMVTSSSMFLSIIDGLIFAPGRLGYSLGALGPEYPILNPSENPGRRWLTVG